MGSSHAAPPAGSRGSAPWAPPPPPLPPSAAAARSPLPRESASSRAGPLSSGCRWLLLLLPLLPTSSQLKPLPTRPARRGVAAAAAAASACLARSSQSAPPSLAPPPITIAARGAPSLAQHSAGSSAATTAPPTQRADVAAAGTCRSANVASTAKWSEMKGGASKRSAQATGTAPHTVAVGAGAGAPATGAPGSPGLAKT